MNHRGKQKKKVRKAKEAEDEVIATEHWHPYTCSFAAYLAGDYAALHDLEQRAAEDEEGEAGPVGIPF